MSGPYDLMQFPQASVHLATYGDPPCSIRAPVEVHFGDARPGGHLPVTLPGAYPFGAGMG